MIFVYRLYLIYIYHTFIGSNTINVCNFMFEMWNRSNSLPFENIDHIFKNIWKLYKYIDNKNNVIYIYCHTVLKNVKSQDRTLYGSMVRTCWTRPAGCDVGLVDLRRPENNRWDPSTCCPPGRPGIGPASRLKGLSPKRQRSSPRRSYYIAGGKPGENRLLRLCDIVFFFVLRS